MKKTLEQILEQEKARRHENGNFGIKACKELIKADCEAVKKYYGESAELNLYSRLEEYVKKANKDIFFNNTMVLACWELIQEIEYDEQEQ